jgi:hypothetical protein
MFPASAAPLTEVEASPAEVAPDDCASDETPPAAFPISDVDSEACEEACVEEDPADCAAAASAVVASPGCITSGDWTGSELDGAPASASDMYIGRQHDNAAINRVLRMLRMICSFEGSGCFSPRRAEFRRAGGDPRLPERPKLPRLAHSRLAETEKPARGGLELTGSVN